MLLSTLILLPLALAHPHTPPRRHHAHARAAVTDRPLVERAGGASGNDSEARVSAWEQSNAAYQQQQQQVQTSSNVVVDSASAIAGVGTALTAVNSAASSAVPTSVVQVSSSVRLIPHTGSHKSWVGCADYNPRHRKLRIPNQLSNRARSILLPLKKRNHPQP